MIVFPEYVFTPFNTTLPVFAGELKLSAPVDEITPSTVNVVPATASISPAPVITTPLDACNSSDALANSKPPLNVTVLVLAPKLASELIDNVPEVSVVPPVYVFIALNVVNPPPLMLTLPPVSGALTDTDPVLLKTNEGLLNTPEPLIEPPDTVTVPTASE
jgi:hypothetical protein